ncbi:MAG TPA: sulfate adenylyltransferase, partial [Cellvibrionales bacterium]|nr:sulfate adenylyltransferase [Cellvibrionales bacterium]
MIKPHGSKQLMPLYVADDSERAALTAEAENLTAITISSAAAANAVMLAAGYFTPLTGYMNLMDSLSVAQKLHTVDGLFWPVPIVNLVEDASGIEAGQRIALKDPNVEGHPVLAVMQVDAIESVSDAQMDSMVEQIFGTLDANHPGVAAFRSQGNIMLSGAIQVLNYSYFQADFPDTYRTAVEIRAEMELLGWEKAVAFQTRNPMHRAHEELCHMAMERLEADGVVV